MPTGASRGGLTVPVYSVGRKLACGELMVTRQCVVGVESVLGLGFLYPYLAIVKTSFRAIKCPGNSASCEELKLGSLIPAQESRDVKKGTTPVK